MLSLTGLLWSVVQPDKITLAIESLKKLDVPYMVTVPLSFKRPRNGKTLPRFAPGASRVASRTSGIGRWFGADNLFRLETPSLVNPTGWKINKFANRRQSHQVGLVETQEELGKFGHHGVFVSAG